MNQHSVPIWDSRSDSSDQRSGQGRRAARADQIHPNHRDDVKENYSDYLQLDNN